MQTTRYRTGGPAWPFEESHSHAPTQWLHGLSDPRLADARHVVLVDDEISTGHTFEALEAVLRTRLPRLETVQWACLTDFRPAEHRRHPAASLLRGAWSFVSNGTAAAPPAVATQPVDPGLLQCDHGRLHPLSLAARATATARLAALAGHLEATRAARGRVLIVGTGEFMPMPFELVEELEKRPARAAISFQPGRRPSEQLQAIPSSCCHCRASRAPSSQPSLATRRFHCERATLSVDRPSMQVIMPHSATRNRTPSNPQPRTQPAQPSCRLRIHG